MLMKNAFAKHHLLVTMKTVVLDSPFFGHVYLASQAELGPLQLTNFDKRVHIRTLKKIVFIEKLLIKGK